MKLLAVWSDLSLETQICLLRRLAPEPHAMLHSDVVSRALTSENEYVRYLAARHFSSYGEKDPISDQIASDPSELVRAAREELRFSPLFDLSDEEFFGRSMEWKLAVLRSDAIEGNRFADLIRWGLINGIDETQLTKLTIEYVCKPVLKTTFSDKGSPYDGYGAYLLAQDFDALWKLAANVPATIATILVHFLPAETSAFRRKVPDDAVEAPGRLSA